MACRKQSGKSSHVIYRDGMRSPKEQNLTFADIPHDVFTHVFSKLSPQQAFKLAMSSKPLYNNYRRDLVKLKDHYENIPTPREVAEYLQGFVETADVCNISFTMVESDDFMDEESYIAPNLHITSGDKALKFAIRFYEECPTDPRLVEMRVLKRVSPTSLQQIAIVIINKVDAIAPYDVTIIGGNDVRLARDVITYVTMIPHAIAGIYEKCKYKQQLPQQHGLLFHRVVTNAVARIAEVYPMNMKNVLVRPAVVLNQSPYALSRNVQRRTSPMNVMPGGRKKRSKPSKQ